jgi:tRNA pseudouridine38-40 synthase
MQRYFVQLSFKGTNYHGWQIQPNAVTVQETVERAFSAVLREKIEVVGAGRTDTGVHASFFIFHFDSQNSGLETDRLVYRLNGFLPADIALKRIWKVPAGAHARFSALSRTYKYYIHRKKDPFKTETSCLFTGSLDIEKMKEGADLLPMYSDFTSFSRLHSDVKTHLCRIIMADWDQDGNTLVFTIEADRFLRNMVRAITGTLIQLGTGKLTPEEFRSIINARDRRLAGDSAPARGLFLTDIKYPANLICCNG